VVVVPPSMLCRRWTTAHGLPLFMNHEQAKGVNMVIDANLVMGIQIGLAVGFFIGIAFGIFCTVKYFKDIKEESGS